MPADFIRVRDTRTDAILPHTVPRAHLESFPYLKEVPSSRKADRVRVTEPVQPAAGVPVTEPHQSPADRGPAAPAKPIKEPAKPEKPKEA